MKYTVLLAALAALSLAPTVHAQSLILNSGDNVTVSGAGTVGTISGAPVANTTTTYNATYQGPGYFPTVVANGTASFTLGPGGKLTATLGNYESCIATTGSGTITITDGTIMAGSGAFGLYQTGSATVNISGGTFSAGPYGVDVYCNSANGTLNITGGTFTIITSGTGLATNGTVINLYSQGDTPFLINGVPMNNTSLPAGSSGTISGTLLNGDVLNTTFAGRGVFKLNVGTPPIAAPEPSSLAALAVGIPGLGVLILRARRRRPVK